MIIDLDKPIAVAAGSDWKAVVFPVRNGPSIWSPLATFEGFISKYKGKEPFYASWTADGFYLHGLGLSATCNRHSYNIKNVEYIDPARPVQTINGKPAAILVTDLGDPAGDSGHFPFGGWVQNEYGHKVICMWDRIGISNISNALNIVNLP